MNIMANLYFFLHSVQIAQQHSVPHGQCYSIITEIEVWNCAMW